MAGKHLISERTVLDAVRAGQTSITVPEGAIFTPSARDAIREHALRIASGDLREDRITPPSSSRVICVGSDHGGFDLKQMLVPLLSAKNWKIVDVGTDSPRKCDYPDFAYAVARMVSEQRAGFGIMIDGAGIGSAIVCNKVTGIRAANAWNEFTAWNARAHNNANVLTLGSRSMGVEVCKRVVDVFLATQFEGGRHETRVQKMHDVEVRFSR